MGFYDCHLPYPEGGRGNTGVKGRSRAGGNQIVNVRKMRNTWRGKVSGHRSDILIGETTVVGEIFPTPGETQSLFSSRRGELSVEEWKDGCSLGLPGSRMMGLLPGRLSEEKGGRGTPGAGTGMGGANFAYRPSRRMC